MNNFPHQQKSLFPNICRDQISFSCHHQLNIKLHKTPINDQRTLFKKECMCQWKQEVVWNADFQE